MSHDDFSNDEHDAIAAWEAKWVAGFIKDAGKHVAAGGLVSRGGYRRVFRDSPDWRDVDWQAEKLEEVAAEVLHGRNATVFENLVINPIRRRPGKSVKALA